MGPNEREVLGAIQRMTESFQDGDLDAIWTAYEPGAVVTFEAGQPVSDPTLMRQTFAQWVALSPRFEYDGHDVLVVGDLSLHVAPWTMRGRSPDGSAIEQTGLSIAVLRRQPDGSWLIVIDNPHGHRLLKGQ